MARTGVERQRSGAVGEVDPARPCPALHSAISRRALWKGGAALLLLSICAPLPVSGGLLFAAAPVTRHDGQRDRRRGASAVGKIPIVDSEAQERPRPSIVVRIASSASRTATTATM
jgi:hypothetical protein